MRPLHLAICTALFACAALTGCIPPDPDGADAGPSAGGEPEPEGPAGASIGADCRCPAAECDADAEVCACEAEASSGPCADGLTCLGSPGFSECTRACDDDSECPDGFSCTGLQIGSVMTGQWCFASQ